MEVNDRIFSTAVDMSYTFPPHIIAGVDDIGDMEKALEFGKAAKLARDITLDLFATHDSASVQVGFRLRTYN